MRLRPLIFTIVLGLAAASLRAEDRYELSFFGGVAAPYGVGNIQGTSLKLDFEAAPAAQLQITRFWTPNIATSLAASFAQVPVKLSDGAGSAATGDSIRVVPVTGVVSYVFNPGSKLQPYAGAGFIYYFFRRADSPVTLGPVEITRIEQPDHLALLLDGGARYTLTPTLSLIADGRWGPAQSTAEVWFADGKPRQANFHALTFMLGVGWHF